MSISSADKYSCMYEKYIIYSWNIKLFVHFALFILHSGVSTTISVTQQMTEMSLSCEEKGASRSKVELTEPGGYQIWTC